MLYTACLGLDDPCIMTQGLLGSGAALVIQSGEKMKRRGKDDKTSEIIQVCNERILLQELYEENSTEMGIR